MGGGASGGRRDVNLLPEVNLLQGGGESCYVAGPL